MLDRVRSPGLVVAGVLVGALACWLMIGAGFANYDLAYALVWGADLAHGRQPNYDVTLAPTPHPLATLEGLILSPLGGAGAEDAATVIAFLALGALGVVVYLLGKEWFGRIAGVLAAVIVLTREPVLSFGVRGYLDLPYVALVLGALLVEVRKPRAGVPVLVLLGLAGLLRPEAWLFSGAYVLWRGEDNRQRLRWAALAAIAPAIWVLSDWLIAGDPLHSLTGTRDNADVLHRKTGLGNVPGTLPRRIGEIDREPVLLGAALGGVLALYVTRQRVITGAAAGVVAIVAFCIFAVAGLPIIGRYLLLPAAILAIFCAGAVTGWTSAPEGTWRRVWQGAAVLTVLALVAFTPKQFDRIRDLRHSMKTQDTITADLRSISDKIPGSCTHVRVETHRPVPLLALYTGQQPTHFPPGADHFDGILSAANERVEHNFVLDPADPAKPQTVQIFGTLDRVRAQNRSWILQGC